MAAPRREEAESSVTPELLGPYWLLETIGQGRMGVKLTSVMAYLRTVMRLPVRQIQAYLATLHGLKISSGEIIELLHRAKAHLEPLVAALKQEIRASPAVQADETGWREDGSNGYIWSISTPTLRYAERQSEQVLSTWIRATSQASANDPLAVDGKTVRGARTAEGNAPHRCTAVSTPC